MIKKLLFWTLMTLILAGGLGPYCLSDVALSDDSTPSASDLISGKPQALPVPGMVNMVDIGAHSCVPCKMMAPIIKELSVEYAGRAAIAFIDVWQYPDEIDKYGIRLIPTQIFYDASGQEQYRHVGFMGREAIVSKLTELGVK